MSTLLVGVILAYSRHAKQLKWAADRHQAIEAADRLLEQWHHAESVAPRTASGRLAEGDLLWRTEAISQEGARRLGIDVIRLTVRRSGASVDSVPLVQVDFVAPVPTENESPPSIAEGGSS